MTVCVDFDATGNKCSANSLQVVRPCLWARQGSGLSSSGVATFGSSVPEKETPANKKTKGRAVKIQQRNLLTAICREREGNKYYLTDVGSYCSAVKSGACRQAAVHMYAYD
jgi:hypothetical protein